MRSPASTFPRRGVLRRGLILVGALACAVPASRAGLAETAGAFFSERLDAIRLTLREGAPEFYATGYTWHLPWGYDNATRSRLNNTNWGGGIGRSFTDHRGDQNSVFFVTLSDSHRKPQFVLSYGWQRPWLAGRDWSVSWGGMAFLFAREDVANYCPLPAVLPNVAARWRQVELVGLFVPRVSHDIKGNVFFVMARVRR